MLRIPKLFKWQSKFSNCPSVHLANTLNAYLLWLHEIYFRVYSIYRSVFHLKSIVVMLSKKRSKNGTWRSGQSWFIVTYLVMKILSISSPFCQFLLAQSMFVHSSHMWVVNKIHIHYNYNNNKKNNVVYTHRTILKLTCASAFAFFGPFSCCRV